MSLTLGPIPGLWAADRVYAFYEAAVKLPVASIYVGETVCSKRRAMRTSAWIDLAGWIAKHGKQVVLSTLTLIESQSELATLKRLCGQDEVLVEANDYAAVALLRERGVPWVGGSTLNAYNAPAVRWLVRNGLRRWQPPVDMDLGSLKSILSGLAEPERPEVEVLGWGRLPLAWSARCFCARYHQRPKDDCGFVCERHPDGIEVRTREGVPFLTINGVQALSAGEFDVMGRLRETVDAGVSLLRITPATDGTGAAARRLDEALAKIRADSSTRDPAPCPR